MSDITMTQNQGSFTQTNPAANKFISIPSGFDWIEVFNQTKAAAAGGGAGVKFYFNPHTMTNGRGFVETKTAVTNALAIGEIAAGAGFFVYDSSIQQPGAAVALTAISNGNPPVVSTANTSGLFEGDTVRIYNTTGALQLGGIDFTIGTIVANTSFELLYMAQIVAGTNGTFRKIPFDPIYYPRNRIITKISAQAVTGYGIVTLSVTHGYHIGQKIRFIIPTVTNVAFGMTELNDVVATIVAIGDADADGVTNTITVDVDVSTFTAFAFPLTADGDFTPAQIVPAGMNTAEALRQGVNIHSDASRNEAQLGVLLMAGAGSPAGQANDVISWRAGVSFTVDPE
jgi:hypothetical protein